VTLYRGHPFQKLFSPPFWLHSLPPVYRCCMRKSPAILPTAIYARVSTDEQSVDSQLQQCRAWCERNGVAATEFTESVSAVSAKRVAFDEMMRHIRDGRVKLIVTYKMDRLGRSVVQLAQFIGEMDALGVAVVCISQGVDTRVVNPMGRMQMQMLMVFAEFERSIIRERTRAGLDAAKARGVVLGRPKGSGRLKLPLDEARVAIAGGKTIWGFARERGISETSLRRAMSAANP
jgi:DNA invertase Pin-like site-specific DNA recombinase